MKIQLLRWTSDHLEKKVPVAAAAWTLFYFCNPSNVLSPLWTPKLIFREVNSQYYWGPVKSHLQRKKTGKSQLSLFHWFWTHSPPHLRFRRQIGRRIVERIEDRKKSSYYFQRILPEGYKGGGANDHFFEGESPFKKARRFAQEVNFKILQNEANNDPKKTGGKKRHGTGVRTRRSTFVNYAIFLQPQGDLFAGPMLADVCCTRMCKLTESLRK